MSVQMIQLKVLTKDGPACKYLTCDGNEFFDLDEAVEYDNKYHDQNNPKPVYEQFWSMQEAINKAVAENRPVRFITDKTNKELKKGIVDIKGCKLMKPDRDSHEVAVIPPGIEDFDFNAVDTSLTVRGESN